MAVFIKKVNIPQKSDLINIDMTGSGTAQTYRIIKVLENDVVEVIAMADASTSQAFGNNNTYANSSLDTYLNTTWYNTLSNTAKEAIVDKTFRQQSWYYGTDGDPDYKGTIIGGNTYQLSLGNASFGNEITRHCYAISVQDVLDYLEVTPEMTTSNTTLNPSNILMMCWNTTGQMSGQYLWLSSALASDNSRALMIAGNTGQVTHASSSGSYRIRPAFQIDLSKIDYTFTDGRQPVELKPVSILQKSNNALSRVGMSWKIPPEITGLSTFTTPTATNPGHNKNVVAMIGAIGTTGVNFAGIVNDTEIALNSNQDAIGVIVTEGQTQSFNLSLKCKTKPTSQTVFIVQYDGRTGTLQNPLWSTDQPRCNISGSYKLFINGYEKATKTFVNTEGYNQTYISASDLDVGDIVTFEVNITHMTVQ